MGESGNQKQELLALDGCGFQPKITSKGYAAGLAAQLHPISWRGKLADVCHGSLPMRLQEQFHILPRLG